MLSGNIKKGNKKLGVRNVPEKMHFCNKLIRAVKCNALRTAVCEGISAL